MILKPFLTVLTLNNFRRFFYSHCDALCFEFVWSTREKPIVLRLSFNSFNSFGSKLSQNISEGEYLERNIFTTIHKISKILFRRFLFSL